MTSLPPNPKVAWVGVGAIGLLYGATLARAGVEVHFLLRSDFEAARSGGIRVRSPNGNFHVPPEGFYSHRSAETIPPVDLVVISTKTTANRELPGLLRPLVHPNTRVLTLQNGFGNEALLAGQVEPVNVLGGTAFVSVHRIAPATADHQHAGRIAIGQYDRPPDEGTEAVAALLRRTGFQIDVLPSLAVGRWTKQVWNVPFNGLGAAMLADTEMLLRTETGRSLLRQVMAEVIAIARAEGITAEHIPDSIIDRNIKFTLGMGPYKTSMQLDREQGRAMEIDSIITSMLTLARKHKISAPALTSLEVQLRAVDTATSACV